ncbi:MAG: DUF4214 domain-containing protein [Pseudomonadota bacterium]
MGEYFGTDTDDSLEGSGAADLLFASHGDDVLIGNGGTDTAIYDAIPLEDGVFINNSGETIDGVDPLSVLKRGVGLDRVYSIEAFHGTNADDVIYAGALADYVIDRGGDDLVVASNLPAARVIFIGAGSGNDRYVGSDKLGDTVDYAGASEVDAMGLAQAGIAIDLASGTGRDPWGDADILEGIEHLWGTDYNDILVGSEAGNFFRGQGGNDALNAGAGNDTLIGGPGHDRLEGGTDWDTADYSEDPRGIRANLADGRVDDGFGATDALISIEMIRGTAQNDTLLGAASEDWLFGGAGNDQIWGEAGNDVLQGGPGNDTLRGGAGERDRLVFAEGGTGVDVDLVTGRIFDGHGGTDDVKGIEEIIGTAQGDILRGGNAGTNLLDGGGGDDVLVGGSGYYKNDLIGRDGDDTLIGGVGAGFTFFEPGRGDDVIEGQIGSASELSYFFDGPGPGGVGIAVRYVGTDFGEITDYAGGTDRFSGIDQIRGTQGADLFVGAAGNETFRGFAGNDTMEGGGGTEDRADYSREIAANGASRGIDVDLALGQATDGYGTTDTLSGIEEILATPEADILRGSTADEILLGAAGDDTFEGRGGDDFLRGGAGEDTAIYAGDAGNYVITIYGGRATIDVLDKRPGSGTGRDGLEGIETLFFDSGVEGSVPETLNLRVLTPAVTLDSDDLSQLAEVYIAYFNRAPDALGLLYWGARMADGMAMEEIAASFSVQPEARALYGGADAGTMVDAAYANLLARAPDAEGREYWVRSLESGRVDPGQFMLDLIAGAKGADGAAADVAVLADKTALGLRYAVDYGLTDPGRAAEAMAAYDPANAALTRDAVEGIMAEYRDAALRVESTELVLKVGAFGADPLDF